MKQFKGTPGPWKQDAKFGQIQSSDGSSIVMLFGKSAKKEDKSLIAAAPELLEAIQEALNEADLPEFIVAKFNRVVSKAIMEKKFALLTDEKTACDETTVCVFHNQPEFTNRITTPKDVKKRIWVDCSGNDECKCIYC